MSGMVIFLLLAIFVGSTDERTLSSVSSADYFTASSADAIATNADNARSVFAIDVDGDGDVTDSATALSALDITTDAASRVAALHGLTAAINSVNAERANIGATINRLEYAVDNLSNISQNTSASRSRVLDADYASETTELARTQIIQQAATAMLSQANQQAQTVLALLK